MRSTIRNSTLPFHLRASIAPSSASFRGAASSSSARLLLRSTSSIRFASSSSVPPRPGSEDSHPNVGGTPKEDVDYTEYIAKMDRLENPKGGLPLTNKIAALLTGIPMLMILYHMLFPTPIEKNEWYQMEKEHQDRVQRAMEEATTSRK